MTPFLSYLVTCKNDGSNLKELLDKLYEYKNDSECIILDDFSDNPITIDILQSVINKDSDFYKVYTHALDKNYGAHKNYGKSKCNGQWIFQCDSDELPHNILLENLIELIKLNEDVELIWVPRVNDFKGVTYEHAAQWKWILTPYEDRLIVNFPDFQSRAFRNLPHIKWERRLHEKVEGAKSYAFLPAEYEYSLFHNKTIDKQIQTNIRYNQQFTDEENKGFKI